MKRLVFVLPSLPIITLVCFLLIGNTAMADITDDLIVYFSLDEGKGTTVKDDSGNGYDGKILDDNKVERVDGRQGFGKALNFCTKEFEDKPRGLRTGRIEVQHDLGSHKALSISLWFFATMNNDWNYIMDFRPQGNPAAGSWFGRKPDNLISFNGMGGVKGGEYPRNEWVHLVVLADSSSTRYYINGKPAGSAGGAAVLNIGTNLVIGCCFSKNESFLGIMDDIAIWDRIISEEEIAQANKGTVIVQAAVQPEAKLATTWSAIKSDNMR